MLKILNLDKFKICFVICMLILLSACGSGNTSGGSSSSDNPPLVQEVPGLGTVTISQTKFYSNDGEITSGGIVINPSVSTFRYEFKVKLPQDVLDRNAYIKYTKPDISEENDTCIATEDSPSCGFVFYPGTTPDGTYQGYIDYRNIEIVSTQVSIESYQTLSEPVDFVVSNNISPQPDPVITWGSLSVLTSPESIVIGESGVTTITLSNSSNVESITVNISSNDANILSLNATSCNLSTLNNTCNIRVNANQLGAVTLTVSSSNNYSDATNNIVVIPVPAIGDFMMMGNYGIATQYDVANNSVINTKPPQVERYASASNNNGVSLVVDSFSTILRYEAESSQLINAGLNLTYQGVASTDGNNGFIIVGEGGSTYLSTDSGYTWTAGTNTPNSEDLYSVTCNYLPSSVCVAVGNVGGIYRTTDIGTTWQDKTIPSGPRFNYVTNKESNFYAVSDNGLLYRSIDNGVTWESRVVASNSELYSITYKASNNMLVAVGKIRLGTSANRVATIYTSADNGDTWGIAYQNSTIREAFRTVIYDSTRDRFIALGRDGLKAEGWATPNTWESQNFSDEVEIYTIFKRGTNTYYGVGREGSEVITPDNGVTWDVVPTNTALLYASTYVPQINAYFIGGSGGDILATMNLTAPTWIQQPTSLTNDIYSVACNSINCVGVSYNDVTYASYIDGNWQNGDINPTSAQLSQVTVMQDDSFILVGDQGQVYKSITGESWVSTSLNPNWNLKAVTKLNDGKIIIGAESTNGYKLILLSNNSQASAWNPVYSNNTLPGNIKSIVQNKDGVIVAVGENGTMLRSTNPVSSWTIVPDPTPGGYTLNSIAANKDGVFLTVGYDGITLKSIDGANSWTTESNFGIELYNVIS